MEDKDLIQQLAEANKEIERLKEDNRCLREVGLSKIEERDTLQSELAEANKEIEYLKHLNKSLYDKDELESELTQLKASKEVGVVPQVCSKCNGEGYVFNIGNSSTINRVCPVCNGTKLIYPVIVSSHITPKESDAVEFAEWCNKNYMITKPFFNPKWVSYDREILVNGSEQYYDKLISEHGKTTPELYSIYKQSKTKG